MPKVNTSNVLVNTATYRAIGELSPVLGFLALLSFFTGGFAGGSVCLSLYTAYTSVTSFVNSAFPSNFCPVSAFTQCEKTFPTGAAGLDGSVPPTSSILLPRIVVRVLSSLLASLLSSASLFSQKFIFTAGAQTYATPL